MKRSRLRPVSKKRRQSMDRMRQDRRDYLAEFPQCVICLGRSTEVHEIASGGGRSKAFEEPATWLPVCNDCNCNCLTNKKEYPVALQLAIKLVDDPTRFDLGKFNLCYALGSVHLDQVAKFLQVVVCTEDLA